MKLTNLKKFLFVLCNVMKIISVSGGLLSNLDYLGRLIYQATLNCGCPCREVEIVNCRVLYETVCKPGYYENCAKLPRVIEEREIQYECQDCFSEYQTVTVPTVIKECHPVYDEKCTTSYIPQCSTSTECTRLYKTLCEISGYSQNCKKIPYERCTPITKCHRTPETKCRPYNTKKCRDVPSTKKEQREFKKCYPYPDKKVPQSCNGFLDQEKSNAEEKTRQNIVAPSDANLDYYNLRDTNEHGTFATSVNPALDTNALLPISRAEEALLEESHNYALDLFELKEELLPAAKNTGSEFGPITDGFRPVRRRFFQK